MKWLMIVGLWLSLSACTNDGTSVAPNSSNSNSILQEAIQAMQGREYGRALELAQQSISFDSNNARAYSVIGLIYQRQRNSEKAQENFSKAVQLAPGDVAIRNNYGNYLCADRRYNEAQENFLIAANDAGNPDPDIALVNAGLCALRNNDKPAASNFFTKAVQLNGAQTSALYQLAKLAFENEDALTASGFLQHYLSHREHNAKTLWLAAQIEGLLNNPVSQQELLLQLKNDFPDSPEARSAAFTSIPAQENAAENTIPIATAIPIEPENILVPEPEPTPQVQSRTSATNASLNHDWILSRDPFRYTIQLYTAAEIGNLQRIANTAAIDGIETPASFGFIHNGENKYTLISGDYDSATEARTALLGLSSEIKQYQPWIRRFDSIQRVISNKGIQ